jgi:hypothetical protein
MKTLTLTIALNFLAAIAFSQTTSVSSVSAYTTVQSDETDTVSITDSIVDDLFKLHIIKERNHVSFNLKHNAFKVNDNVQSQEVLEKFKKKYHIVKGYSIAYAKTKGSTSTSITKRD